MRAHIEIKKKKKEKKIGMKRISSTEVKEEREKKNRLQIARTSKWLCTVADPSDVKPSHIPIQSVE